MFSTTVTFFIGPQRGMKLFPFAVVLDIATGVAVAAIGCSALMWEFLPSPLPCAFIVGGTVYSSLTTLKTASLVKSKLAPTWYLIK